MINQRNYRRLRTVSLTVLTASLAMSAVGCKKKSHGSGAAGGEREVVPAPSTPPVPAGGNLLKNSDFEEGSSLPWMTSFSAPAEGRAFVKDGWFCLQIDNAGVNKWDAQIRHREMVIEKGHTYTFTFDAYASKETLIRPKIGMAGPPYGEYFAADNLHIVPVPQRFTASFTMNGEQDPTAELAFHMGGRMAAEAPVTICIDNLRLDDPQFTPPPKVVAAPPPKVLVNQLGYYPKLAKRATLVNDSTDPVKFQVVDAKGGVVFSGESVPMGKDVASGDNVHILDFSAFSKQGEDYVVQVGEDKSYPFAVGTDQLKKMKYDALNYFYQNRSGIEIKMPFAREEKWARPAGHLPDVASCTPDIECGDYKQLDVTGGWYDAGDHGKYVVNGGISLWTMLNQYERFKLKGKSIADFGDKKLNIPESGNSKPDILDEARWEMEFMLKMIAPSGKYAGMVHHKMHDNAWTALGMRPDQDTLPRVLRGVSTAATLNVAANAAQSARLYKDVDATFAATCLAAAEKTWKAAVANPKKFALASDISGGGPYDDDHLDDEFFWAASELFITTGKSEYLDAIMATESSKKLMASNGADSLMTWQVTDGLGAISLLVTNNNAPAALKDQLKKQLLAAADYYLGFISAEGYRVPFRPAKANAGYPWGSNSFVVNNMLVMAIAYDLTNDIKYLNGMSEGMDYLLGRNPLGQSYVSGYGTKPLEHPHHRFWSNQVDSRFPTAPPGALSGGPNSGLQDPYVQAAGLAGCSPQKCFVDNIEAWSANEITVNWNAPLAWVTAYLDENGR